MKIAFRLRTILFLLLGITILMGLLSVGFVGFGFSRFQEANQHERDTRLLASRVNEALSDFRRSRSLSNRFLIVTRDIRHFYEAKLKYLPEFQVAVEDARVELAKASKLATAQGIDIEVFSFLPTQLIAYERSFLGLVNLTKKPKILRKETQQKSEQLMSTLEPISEQWKQQGLMALLLEARLLEPVATIFEEEEKEEEFLVVINRLQKRITAVEIPDRDRAQLGANIIEYRTAVIDWFEALDSKAAGIERFAGISSRIDNALEKLQYDTQVAADKLSVALPSVLRWIPTAVVGVTSTMVLVVGLLVWFVTLRFIRGTSRLLEGVQRISQGNLGEPVLLEQTDELGDLATFFNKMAEELSISMKKIEKNLAAAEVTAETEKKRSEELQKAKKDLENNIAELARSNKELEEFAYLASHDLQEPLRKVRTFGDRLKDKYGQELGEQGQDYLERMQNATTRMRTLINDLLTYSRVTTKAQPFIEVNLGAVIEEVLSDLEIKIEETQARVKVAALPVIEADPLQMRQLFQNLIDNAIKYCKPQTPPMVEINNVCQSGEDDPESEASSNGPLCEIRVKDNGIGFDEKYKEQIFGVFQRLHGRKEYAGTGIGLALCRKIVLRHGGNMTAQSTPDEGATFVVTLPFKQSKEGEQG